MRKATLPLIVIYFFTCVGQGGATVCSRSSYYHDPNDLATSTGTVQATGRNTIEIFDEIQKRLARFIDTGQLEGFHKGDYVRVFYHPHGAIVVAIKRMTVLDYKENGQNLGNIFHQISP